MLIRRLCKCVCTKHINGKWITLKELFAPHTLSETHATTTLYKQCVNTTKEHTEYDFNLIHDISRQNDVRAFHSFSVSIFRLVSQSYAYWLAQLV